MWRIFSVSVILCCSVLASPLKFPDQPSQNSPPQNREQDRVPPAQSEGRFLSIHKVHNGLFNKLSATNSLQDDVVDYDDSVQDSGITSPTPTAADVEDRRRHRNRKRPCVPYTPFRSNNNNVGRQADQGQGRTFFSLFWNDYNFFGGGGSPLGSPQYDTYGGYPCYSLGGAQNHRPHRPHRPYYEGTNPSGVQSDTPDGIGGGGAGAGQPGWFAGPGGFLQSWLNSWFLRPQGGSGVLGDSAGSGGAGGVSNNVRPVVELNVQDTVQDVVSQRAEKRPRRKTNQPTI